MSRGVARRGNATSGTPIPSLRRSIWLRWRSRRARPKWVDDASADFADADKVTLCEHAAIAGVLARPGRSGQHELTTAGSNDNPISARSSAPNSSASVTGVSSGRVTIIAWQRAGSRNISSTSTDCSRTGPDWTTSDSPVAEHGSG